ncbi:hypothetical protein LI90_870 [Carbonactinospora thermoautotrophica]|uniref:WXG100 family type VII secretion target n=1 Tax=Carbonactinospora thermoautotrophica TaxID=1469144 RepID=A0A132MN02_9ACTN|nr:hypothetical protein [Carbonactinospora thermoautotrophica]KWW99236.1 hypothetical protein LI90_870 [Carbonactinospora thermoautotrophica]
MADGFGIKPDQIRNVSPQFTSAGEELLRAIEEAQRELDAFGAPWGDDEMGSQFANGGEGNPGYLANAQKAFESFRQLAEALGGLGGLTKAMADQTERADEAVAGHLGSFDGPMGGIESRIRGL